jgi:Mg2+/citrate symporter
MLVLLAAILSNRVSALVALIVVPCAGGGREFPALDWPNAARVRPDFGSSYY